MRATLLLFLSGATALVYQTLWVKQLTLVVGVDVYAVSICVAAFFTGLALGATRLGRAADRSTRPLTLYAWLEIGIALLGVCATLGLSRSAHLFVMLQESVGPLAWALPFLLVGFPAFLMGGTLPALVRTVTSDAAKVGRASGLLYAANTAGAVVGTLATPFLLVPQFGVHGTAIAAAMFNVLLAVTALAMSLRHRVGPARIKKAKPMTRDARLAVTLYAAAGGIALGYEVVWTQAIVQFLSTRTYAFAIVLATYLTGLFVGSFLYARFADRVRHPLATFGLLVAGAGVSALALFAMLGPWLPNLQTSVGEYVLGLSESRLMMMCARFTLASAVLLLVPTIFLGAAFPAAVRLVAGDRRIGRDVGMVAALNTLGGTAGVFLTGFLAIPALGLVRTLSVLCIAAVVVGIVAVIRSARSVRVAIPLVTAMAVFVVAFAMVIPEDKLARLLADQRGGKLVFYEESAGGSVAVLENVASAGPFHRLYIQGVSNSGDSMTSLRYMRLQALLPTLIHNGDPRSALVVGLGTGNTAGALLAYPGLERRECVELLPAVVRASSHFAGNLDISNDPRATIHVRDGRQHLLSSKERYDVITLEPPPPSAAGVVNLYSREFYELARDRLQREGLVAQWWPLATQNDEDSRSLVRSFIDVFPHATVWTTEMHEMLLVGSMEPIVLDVPRIRSRFQQPEVKATLSEVGVLSTVDLMSTYVTDRDGLAEYVGDAEPVTDDRPRIEHATWLRDGEFPRVLERLAKIRSDPPLKDAEPSMVNHVVMTRHKLWTLYHAGFYAYTGQANRWESMLARLVPEMRRNPYYRWFVTVNER